MADQASIPIPGEKATLHPWRYGLTPQQRAMLNFIVGFSEANGGVMPSFEEMAEHLGLASKSGVHRLVTALERRGHITRDGRRARAIRLTGGGDAKATLDDALSRVLGECLLSAPTRHELTRILAARRKS
jgi:repressor LexA